MKEELVIYTKPKSNISEGIRTIRTNLQFTANEESKVLLVIIVCLLMLSLNSILL